MVEHSHESKPEIQPPTIGTGFLRSVYKPLKFRYESTAFVIVSAESDRYVAKQKQMYYLTVSLK